MVVVEVRWGGEGDVMHGKVKFVGECEAYYIGVRLW